MKRLFLAVALITVGCKEQPRSEVIPTPTKPIPAKHTATIVDGPKYLASKKTVIPATILPQTPFDFAAQRLGASKIQVEAFQFALEQVGISPWETVQMLTSFKNERELNPGINAIFGLDPRQQNQAISFRQALARIQSQDDGSPFSRLNAINRAEQIGITQEEYDILWNNRDAIQNRFLPEAAARLGAKAEHQ
jgi:hypothetical protein